MTICDICEQKIIYKFKDVPVKDTTTLLLFQQIDTRFDRSLLTLKLIKDLHICNSCQSIMNTRIKNLIEQIKEERKSKK
jgi:hypothetical protein